MELYYKNRWQLDLNRESAKSVYMTKQVKKSLAKQVYMQSKLGDSTASYILNAVK